MKYNQSNNNSNDNNHNNHNNHNDHDDDNDNGGTDNDNDNTSNNNNNNSSSSNNNTSSSSNNNNNTTSSNKNNSMLRLHCQKGFLREGAQAMSATCFTCSCLDLVRNGSGMLCSTFTRIVASRLVHQVHSMVTLTKL